MRLKLTPRRRTKRGITLILAILIMSSVVAIGITASTIVVTQVRINEVSTSSHEGYYAAESGLEQGLQEVQRLKSSTTITQATTTLRNLTLPSSANIARENAPFFPSNEKKLLLTSSSSTSQTASTTLKENQSVYVEIYDVDNSLTALPSNLPTLCVFGQSADGANDEVLEITWVAWTTGLETSRSQRVEVAYSAFSDASGTCSGQNGHTVQLQQFYPAFVPTAAQIAGYRVRITALRPTSGNGDVKDFAVYVDTDGGASGAQSPTNQIQLKSVSAGKNQKQALVATFPWTLPLSSLFDFVIFSEQSLQKKIALSVSEEVKSYGPFEVEAGIDITKDPRDANGTWQDAAGNTTGYCVDRNPSFTSDPFQCPYYGWQGIHCTSDIFSTGAYCSGGLWPYPGPGVSTLSQDFRCYQTPTANPTGSECRFFQYIGGADKHRLTMQVPSTAFADCTTGPCNYYVRIRGKFNRTVYVNLIENTGVQPTFYYDYDVQSDAASVALKANEQIVQPFDNGNATSCILPNPVVINPGATKRWYLVFRNPDGADFKVKGSYPVTLDSYDILTQPSFVGPEETFCPTT